MAELSPALNAELGARRVLLFGGVRIELPTRTLTLLDGSGEVPIGPEIFVGRDPVWGVLDTIKGLEDQISDSAPALTVGLIPPADLALSMVMDPALQGSPVTVIVGAIDRATGLPAGEPYVLFAGEIDVTTVKWGAHDRRVEFRVASIAERLFVIEEGRRLSNSFHQLVWPGELGLSFVTGVEEWVPWGQALKVTEPETRTNAQGTGGTGGFSMPRWI